MVTPMDKDIREMHAIIVLNCVNVCFRVENRRYIDMIMEQVFNMIPDELSKNWLKIHHILWVRSFLVKNLVFA
jgi:hypothetical protein